LDQPQDNSKPAEPKANSPAAPSSPTNTSGVAETASTQPSVTAGAGTEPSTVTAGAAKAVAPRPAKENTEVVPVQGASADGGKPEQTPTVEVAKTAPPSAASQSAGSLVKSESSAVAAAKAPASPADQVRTQPTGAATTPEKKARFTIQVGAFHTKTYADAQLEKLKGLGYPAYIRNLMDQKQHPLYLVCFGRFQTLSEAGGAVASFKKKEKMPAVVALSGS
jgi:cell division septation protein DedD